MQDERLIEMVREHDVLYNLSHPKYMDCKFKMEIWKNIGRQLNANGMQCKSRWINIRDQFRRQMSKRRTRSGQAEHKIKRYKYEYMLQFLLPYFSERSTTSNVKSLLDEMNEETGEVDETTVKTELEFEKTVGDAQLNMCRKFRECVKRKNDDGESPDSVLMKYIVETNEASQNVQQKHPIDSFLDGIASTVKTFSPYYQYLAKGRIFAAVQELELEQLQNSANQPESASCSQNDNC